MDHVVVLDGYPEADTKSVIRSHWRQIGGPVPVALSVAAFYGATTQFMGCWGEDTAGRQIHEGLSSRGIDLSLSSPSPDWTTGFAHVWTDRTDGSRTIAFHRGNFTAPTAIDVDHYADVFDRCRILHLDGALPEAALAAATRVKRAGGSVVLDAGSKKPGMEDLLPLVDVLIASDLFCRSWFGDENASVERLLQLGPQAAIRTLAERGAMFSDGQNTIHSPALEITPVDTNGAGDIFSGAILHGLANQWQPIKCLSFANFVAGQACAHAGNSTYPCLDEFRDRD